MEKLYIKLLCLIWMVLCVSCHNDPEDAFNDDEHICYAQLDDTTLFVHPFVHEGQQYVVLPSYWDTAKLVMSICDEPKMERDRMQRFFRPCDEDKMKEVKMIKSKLPTIFICTKSGSMDFINANKKNEETGHIIVVDTLGNVEYNGELETIHGRGNWTWSQKKKPYSIKLANKTKMLGLKKAKKFNLLSQPGDPTGLRNWTALSAAKQMGLNENMSFSFANVYLNGIYAGCYLVTNKVDRQYQHDFLLEIGPLRHVHSDEIQATFQLTHSRSLTVKIPKHPTSEQLTYIEEEWQKVKEAMIKDASERNEQITDCLIDISSFISNYLCQEIFMNMDAGIASVFIGKDSLGYFFADPIWDMESSMNYPGTTRFGNGMYRVLYVGAGLPSDSTGYIGAWGLLYKNKKFRQQISSLYFSQMRGVVKELFGGRTWTSICSYLQTDMEIDNIRWREGVSFEAQCNQMKNWMEKRLQFLDWVWNAEDEDSKCMVTLYNRELTHPIQYVIPRNTKFSEPLPVFESVDVTDLGYEYTFTGYEVDGAPVNLDTLVVNKDIIVMGKWKQTKEPSLYHRFRVWLWNLRHT